jgi:hypothetical protein
MAAGPMAFLVGAADGCEGPKKSLLWSVIRSFSG